MNIEIKGAAFSYDEKKEIFTDMCFALPAGEVMAILGPNGCGKTTLLKCLSGIRKFSRGEIFLAANNSAGGRHRENFVGYVPQITDNPVSYSVFQMVLLGRSRFLGHFSRPSPKDEAVVRDVLEETGITGLADRSYSSLSGGEKQLVLIARALATEARVLIFDEPTSALDLINQYQTVHLMHYLSKVKGYTVVFSTHDPSQALHISDKALLMDKAGRPLFDETRKVITEENLERVFGVETKILEVPCRDGGFSQGVVTLWGRPHGSKVSSFSDSPL